MLDKKDLDEKILRDVVLSAEFDKVLLGELPPKLQYQEWLKQGAEIFVKYLQEQRALSSVAPAANRRRPPPPPPLSSPPSQPTLVPGRSVPPPPPPSSSQPILVQSRRIPPPPPPVAASKTSGVFIGRAQAK